MAGLQYRPQDEWTRYLQCASNQPLQQKMQRWSKAWWCPNQTLEESPCHIRTHGISLGAWLSPNPSCLLYHNILQGRSMGLSLYYLWDESQRRSVEWPHKVRRQCEVWGHVTQRHICSTQESKDSQIYIILYHIKSNDCNCRRGMCVR